MGTTKVLTPKGTSKWDPKKWSEQVMAECEKRGILRRDENGEYLKEDLLNMYYAFKLAGEEFNERKQRVSHAG